MSKNTIELLEKLSNKYTQNKELFYPFIEHIRFPKYKSLVSNSRIDFTFPITLLVGQNGGNKTSILQALYGSTERNSIGDYWFSTDVDEIQSGEGVDRQCFIYGYYFEPAKKIVEILKTRIHRGNNPDYWEPARPQKRYDMVFEKDYKALGSSSATRWNVLKKEVVYCDCKEYVSAFDLFFYHYDFQPTLRQRSKQDFIRLRSKKLAEVIHDNLVTYNYKQKQRIKSNIVASDEVCRTVSDIMGESYDEIKIITHDFYSKQSGNKPSKTIWVQKNGQAYSEAFAGTGEARVILLVNDIINAPENSLLLIDEPEISLHPSAVYRFKDFLLKITLRNNHQVVITTHSTQLLRDFPKEAIKTVSRVENKIKITENIDYQDAFFELGDIYRDKKMIYVEDKLAKYILDFVINKSDSDNLKQNLVVNYIPGGANQIICNNILNSSYLDSDNHYFWLDGDQNTKVRESADLQKYLEDGFVVADKIPEADNENLDKIIQEITGCSIKFKVSGSQGQINHTELIEQQRRFINYWSKYVSYLPFQTPELYLAKLCDRVEGENYDFSTDENGKEYFRKKTQEALGIEDITSEDIFQEQRRAVSKLQSDPEMFQCIKEKLEKLF
ncbi:AAA family ATPase [Streptococcus mitis]|nr:AAA family ATPase [Streptococcus mitis]MQQ14572.1 AAA family ATPase [Streptococcus mitis]MQQ45341.1 AAA family ATPase [Streptococcus mitis]MQQ47216.1 AAA family ATPase [Streptococcus mitis]MQQ58712.1 AAA family ATPase [Streptococcus mitis]